MKKPWIIFGLSVVLAGPVMAADEDTTYEKLEARDLTAQESGRIARAASQMLAMNHYKQIPFNDEISRTQFTNFLSSLDYNRMIFLQSDVDELAARYAESLDDATRESDATPAFEIYKLFKERLDERYEHIQSLLDYEFDFDEEEFFELRRNKGPWPGSKAEAEDVWRKRVKNDFLSGRLKGDAVEETRDMMTKRYRRLYRTLSEFDNEEVLGAYLDALGNAFDPHSDYMTPSERENFEIYSINGELTGIGAMLQNVDGYCTITELTPGGPAALSKQLQPEDRIVAVAQGEDGEWVDVVEEKLDNVVAIIRGEVGSTVRLEIIPAEGGGREEVVLVRNVIKIEDQLPKARLYLHPLEEGKELRLGVVTLPTFHKRAAADVLALVSRLKAENIDGLILDLRRNGGGILDQAVQLTGLFIDKGPVVQVKNSRQRRVFDDPLPGTLYDGPMIVLVSHLSASASEIVAAALQDHGRAIVIGDHHTHGKGTVQTLVSLSPYMRPDEEDPGEMKFTVQKFYRIAGGTTQKYGVQPDYALPSTFDYLELGERFLPNALESDEIEPAVYQPMDLVEPYVAELAARSEARRRENPEFVFIDEDIEILKKQLEARRISLNEAERLREQEESDARTAERKEYRASVGTHDDRIFEFGLDVAVSGERLVSLEVAHAEEAEEAADVVVRSGDEASEADEESIEADPHLDESLNILSDYVRLIRGEELGEQELLSGKDVAATGK